MLALVSDCFAVFVLTGIVTLVYLASQVREIMIDLTIFSIVPFLS